VSLYYNNSGKSNSLFKIKQRLLSRVKQRIISKRIKYGFSGGHANSSSTDIWTIFVGEVGYEEVFIRKA
jgi:hypothetical protein